MYYEAENTICLVDLLDNFSLFFVDFNLANQHMKTPPMLTFQPI